MNSVMKFVFGIVFCTGFVAKARADIVTFQSHTVVDTTRSTLDGDGRNYTINLTLPAFSSSIGTVNFVHIRQKHVLTTAAVSTATGGVFIPPDYIGSWSWGAVSGYRIQGAGIDVSNTELLSDRGSYTEQTSTHEARVFIEQTVVDTGFFSFDAPAGIQFGATTSVGVFYGHSTAVRPLPATPGGFTWTLGETITSAAIRQRMVSTFTVRYDYTPAAAVPEPDSGIVLAFVSILFCFVMRSSRKTMFLSTVVSGI